MEIMIEVAHRSLNKESDSAMSSATEAREPGRHTGLEQRNSDHAIRKKYFISGAENSRTETSA